MYIEKKVEFQELTLIGWEYIMSEWYSVLCLDQSSQEALIILNKPSGRKLD